MPIDAKWYRSAEIANFAARQNDSLKGVPTDTYLLLDTGCILCPIRYSRVRGELVSNRFGYSLGMLYMPVDKAVYK